MAIFGRKGIFEPKYRAIYSLRTLIEFGSAKVVLSNDNDIRLPLFNFITLRLFLKCVQNCGI